eukprot:12925433-Prorocentrum_lima.AAC.1
MERHKLHPHYTHSSHTVKMNGNGGENWLTRHHHRPRRRTYHPDWKSAQPDEAMLYEESKAEQLTRKK